MSGVTTYTQEIADYICEAIADGKSLRQICNEEDMPSRATVFKWLNDIKGFSDQYARAREEQAETLADEIVSIVDNAKQPLMVDGLPINDSEGNPIMVVDNNSISHARLMMDARKWTASKLKPKKYGDRIQTELSGELNVGFHEILTKARERAGS